MARPQKTFMEQFSVAMSRAYLWERCRELTRILPLANTSKDLNVAFVQICSDIFGYAAGGNPGLGWNLTSLTRNQTSFYSQALLHTDFQVKFLERLTAHGSESLCQYSSPKDYLAVFAFLSSSGPMMDLIHKLLPDPSNVFEYSTTQLPNLSMVTGPYGTQMGGSIPLSSFEYFFYHFFNLPIRVQIQSIGNGSSNNNNTASDTIYPILLEDYLAKLLPIDPLQQAKLFSQDIHSHQLTSPSGGQGANLMHQTPVPSPNRPSLFRKDFSPTTLATHHGDPIVTQNVTHPNVSNSNARETWRFDTLVRIISIFWLEPFALESSKNYQKDSQSHSHLMSSPAGESYVTASLKAAASLPSVELIRYTRMFIKHAHYFSNSCSRGAGTIYLPSSLKIQIFGEHISSEVMFHFFRHSIGHWPLDASFKFLLETWLSYIQPWRYVQTQQGQIADENCGTSMDNPEKWMPFLRDNFQFYNNLLGQVLSRFLKQDLCTSKNAYMLFRTFKVLSQDNLIQSLQAVAALLHGTFQTPNFPQLFQQQQQQQQRNVQNLSGWDPMSECEFSNIFGPEFKIFVHQLLLKILESKLIERENLNSRVKAIVVKSRKENNADLVSKIFSFLFGTNGSCASADNEIGEREKLLQNLDFCVDKIANIFNLRQVVDECEQNFFEDKKEKEMRQRLEQSNRDELELSNLEAVPAGLSPLQRIDLINKKIKPDGRYLGHPDLIPIRTDEFTLVVRLLHKLSIKINQKWGETISDFYHRTSPAGALCRQICAPPATYLEKSHDDFGKRVNRLPARIVLRPLASYRVIFYLCLFFFVSLFIFGKSSLVTLIILFFGYFLYISVNAFVLNPIDPDNSSFLNESFRSHEKWN